MLFSLQDYCRTNNLDFSEEQEADLQTEFSCDRNGTLFMAWMRQISCSWALPSIAARRRAQRSGCQISKPFPR